MNSLFRSVLLCSLLFFPTITSAIPAVSFRPKVDLGTGDVPYGVAVGDLNRDGKPDLVTANVNDNSVSVRLGDGAGGFGQKFEFLTGIGPWSVTIGDLNGDGKPDLATPNYIDNTVSVLLNNTPAEATTISFELPAPFPTGNRPYVVAIGDLNANGKLDLVVSDEAPGAVSVLLNTTPAGATIATFEQTANFLTGGNASSVVIGDLNGDGKPDLALSKHYNNTVSVLLGDGAGGFPGPYPDFPTGSFPHSLVIGDLNRDGKPDLATGNFNTDTVSVLLNTTPAGATTATFEQATDFAVGSGPFLFAIGDLNGDGKLDLATANYNDSTASVLLGDGLGGFEPNADFATGSHPRSIAIGDLNRDGKLDLATGNTTANTASVLFNNTVCGLVAVIGDSPPSNQLTLSAYPNPTTGQTSVSFQLPMAGPVTLGIYDVLGRRLRQWELATMPAGRHQVEWNGVAEDGHLVPPGVLFYRLSTGGQTLKQKIIRIQ